MYLSGAEDVRAAIEDNTNQTVVPRHVHEFDLDLQLEMFLLSN